jgi:hypothetical protein
MTAVVYPRSVRLERKWSNDLFVVTLWSVVGLAFTALTIWLGWGADPLIFG